MLPHAAKAVPVASEKSLAYWTVPAASVSVRLSTVNDSVEPVRKPTAPAAKVELVTEPAASQLELDVGLIQVLIVGPAATILKS